MSGEPAEARLLALRRETAASLVAESARIDAISAARADANTDDEHDPEGATIGFERAQADALRVSLRRRLGEVDDAIERIAAGTYGFCTVCGEPIAPARLDARPTAARCIRHA